MKGALALPVLLALSVSSGFSADKYPHPRTSPKQFIPPKHYRQPKFDKQKGGLPKNTCPDCSRDAMGRLKPKDFARNKFRNENPCPSTGRATGSCPGYEIGNKIPLTQGGLDAASNMQWVPKGRRKETPAEPQS